MPSACCRCASVAAPALRRPLQPNHSEPGRSASASATARPPARGPRSDGSGTRLETTTRRDTTISPLACPLGDLPSGGLPTGLGLCPLVWTHARALANCGQTRAAPERVTVQPDLDIRRHFAVKRRRRRNPATPRRKKTRSPQFYRKTASTGEFFMRIAQIAPLTESVPPKLYGGTERVVAFLTDELVAMGHDVTLFASGDSVTRAD